MAITESDPIVTGLGEHIFNPAPAPPPLVLMPVERLYPHLHKRSKITDLIEAEVDPLVDPDTLFSARSRGRARLLRGERVMVPWEVVEYVRTMGFTVHVEGGECWMDEPVKPTAEQVALLQAKVEKRRESRGKPKSKAKVDRNEVRSQVSSRVTPEPAPAPTPPSVPMLLSSLTVVGLAALPGQSPTMTLTDGKTVWAVAITEAAPV